DESNTESPRVLIPVPDSSDIFKNSILAPLQRAYLYDESKQFFRYKSAVLVKNPTLEEKYNTFRAKRRDVGYSDEDLEESYGFLLFDDANALRETGVLTGNSTCTTLGDPSKGVYISMYSDCLDLNRWYHGKSGYIAIIRLTKGKVKRVFENYTQNFTAPTVGFDCHVSEQFPSVSAQTSSFLAFERTQCYMYELLDGGSNATAQSPSAACLFAIVSFSYTDTKAAILQIGSQLYNVGLRSKARALLPAKLPPVVKVDWVISMLDLRQLLPRAVFETCFTGEVFLDGLYCSLYELVSTEAEETNSLVQLLWDIKEKDLVIYCFVSCITKFCLCLESYISSTNFFSSLDAWSCASEVLQGLFVFPDSRVVMRDTKFGQKNPSKTSEILRILPVLSYAEGEAEKTPIDPSEELCEVLAQHMQSYTALINPGLASSPSREVSMFPFQYDVPDTHLYSSPEWTDGAMQSFRSYLSRPTSFQLPVSRASEILAAGQEERRREDLDDDVYICISSPEEAPQEFTDPVNTVLEDTLSDLNSSENVETSVENVTSTGAQDDLGVMPHNVVPNDLQLGPSSKDNEKSSDLSELNKTDDVVANNLTPPTSDDLPAELIVSITSAEQSVSNETLNLRAKLQAAEVNSLCDETGYTQKLLNIPQVTSFTETKLKLHTGCSGGSKKASKASVVPSTLQTVKTPVENDSVNSPKDEHTKEIPDHPQLSNPSNWRKLQRRRRKCGKISAKNRKLRSAMVALPIAEEKKTDPEHCPLRRKTERWDLKPIISECGKILVPHGSTDFADQIKSLKDKLQSNKNEECSEKMLLDAPVNADDAVKSDPESCTAPETAVEDMQAANIVEGGNDLQTVTVSDVNPEQKISRESNDGNSSLPLNPESNSSNNEPTDSVSSQEVQEKHSENLSHEKCPTKSEFLLRKLKSVLLRGKRKTDLVTENTAPNTPQDTEPCLKKSKEVDTESEALKCNNKNTPSTNPGVTEDQKMHEKLKNKDCTSDNSVRKTEKMNSAYSPADALNLLADLALSADNDQAPPQPNPSFERKPETSLKKSDLKKDLTSAEQESVLHALLRQPADRSTQPHESPAPSHLVVNRELIGLVSKEHAYSLPPSSSLLLGLPGTSPVSDSSRLHHDQTMYGFQTLQPSVGQEDGSEYDKTPEYLKRCMARRQKFRYSRTFVNTEGCIKVTRHWQENYDFNLDSKFTSDPKDKTIVRALHGPWDFSIQDTNEEVRLIVHMWIGLFYSRSTPRFFHVESNFAYSCSEENDSLEMTSGVVSGLTIFEHKDTAASCPSVPDTSDPLLSKALDLSKNDDTILDQDSARKTFDGQVALTEEADFRTNKTNEGVNKGCIAFESPFTGMNPSEKVIVLVKDDSASHKNTFGQSNNDHEDQKTKSTEEEVKDEEEQFQHQVHSPPCEVPNTSEVKVALTEETDLRTDETNEGLNKSCISDESSFTEIDPLEKVEPMDDNLQNTFEPQPHSPQCEFPKLCETEVAFTEEADFRTSETNEELDKSSIAIDIPFAGRDPSERVTVQVKDDNAIHKNTFGQSNNDHEDQETVSTEEVKDLKQQFQHEVHSPPCEVPKICEAQVAFTKETDLRTNEGLNKSCTGVEIPFIGIDRSEELIVQVKDNTATFQRQLRWKIPKVCEANVAFAEKTDVGRDKKNERLDKRCTEDEISFIGIDASGKDAVLAKVDNATGKEQIQCQPQSLLSEVPKIFEAQVTFTKEIDLRAECKTNEGLDKNCTGVEIPLIGIDSSEKVSVHLHGSHPQGKSGEVVQGQEQIPFISDSSYSKAALTSEICNTTQACSEKEEPCKMLLLDINESYGPVDLGIESDDRCPTPTIDEKPYGYPSCSSPGRSNSALSSSITGKNLKRKCLNTSSAPVHGKLPCEKKPCQSSIVKTDSSLHQILHPDLEARTLRVLQSIDKFLSKSNHIDKSCQIETLKMKESVAQSPEPSSKCTPSSLAFDQPTVDFKDNNEKSALVSSSTSQDLHTESSDNLLVSPFKSKLEEVLGVKLNLKKTDSVPQEYFERVSIQETSIGQNGQFPRTCPSELLQVIKPSLDQERPKPTLQSNVNQESRAYNHRPVLAVKPSKNDESPADYFLVDTEIEKSLKNNPPKTPKLEYSKPTSVLSEKRTNAKSKGCSERLNDNQEASQLSFKTTWLPDVGNSRSNSFPSYQYQRKDISKFDMNPSSPPPMECFESAKSSSKCVDEIQDFLTNGLAEKVEQTVKKNIEMDLKDPSSAAASFIDQRNSDSIDKSLVLGPRSSLVCTVYNNSQKRSYSFLEQVSRRCIQDDLTQASVEQESLIFSEQMKQVLKKSERRPTHQEDSHDKIRLSCTSPLTINFSNLDEQEDSLDYLGASLIGQKIKVDLSNRKDPTDKNEEKMICPGELSEGKYNTVEHDWVSDVTVECARLYEAKMQDVCAFKKVSARARRFRRSCTKTEPSNHFDFCEQMKKEMDKTFRTSLNSVVKKSCRTKYRFYILATSEDVFFEQTKLEAEGHTSVQPSEFFPGDDCSSSLIIILKNEDIAEHICEVPQLLELKKSRHVQFAGIDEPDDVLNLTHQELFMQGGFIMFDRTALDALSLCNMKKVSEILLELSKMGKWKWMLHYRDSRRLKENARLSAEAKEKKHFLYWGQEAGILEVLPYHDCDQMSKDQPDYLTCLVRLQVQKISSRFLVFITATDGAFESNGILTMTTESFLTKPLSEMFTV
uniref:Uncharacterized protein n=1 Tax=Oreochromis niloticus TaxID=8128 RepID=A0A669DFT3_ORENI